MSNLALRITGSISVLMIAFCATVFGQDAPPVPSNAVVQGTIGLIQLTDRLDTHTVKAGDHFRARLAEPLTASNGMTVEVGRKIKGHVSAVEPGLRTRLLLSFDEIETARMAAANRDRHRRPGRARTEADWGRGRDRTQGNDEARDR